MASLLQVTKLTKIYGRRGAATRALDGVNLSLGAGEYVGIMGASGSGKTTLLNCVSTIDRPTSGSILVEGKELTKLRGRELTRFRRERLGFIFQDCDLLDTLTGLENIALALTIQGARPGEVERRARETAALLGLEGVLDKYPYQMSGGEQQRVAAARAIVGRPALVLADEPTGALDSRAAGQLLRQLSWLNREQGTTILMVTHDAFTASWCRRILFIQDGALFRELRREDREDRRTFFARILGVVGALGGDAADVL